MFEAKKQNPADSGADKKLLEQAKQAEVFGIESIPLLYVLLWQQELRGPPSSTRMPIRLTEVLNKLANEDKLD